MRMIPAEAGIILMYTYGMLSFIQSEVGGRCERVRSGTFR